jgi:hypothetical protein
MQASADITHGYRRYGQTYIDRRFIDLYTTLRQICLWFGGELKCQLSSNESIAQCLAQIERQPPTDDSLDKYYQHVNKTLAQTFSTMPKFEAYVLRRNKHGP